jgi:hypothetical protein
MDNLEKIQLLLQHWIDHNKGHAEEFGQWQQTMAAEGQKAIADCLHEAIHSLEQIDHLLAKAMESAGGTVKTDHHHHGHSHDHDHGHNH